MKAKILHNSNVIGFVDSNYPEEEINRNILPVIEACLDKSANVDALQDWTLEFSFTYGNVDDLIIWRKLKSYTSEKVKEIIIHIPVPSINVIDWGVRDEQFLKKRNVDQRNRRIQLRSAYRLSGLRRQVILH